MHQSPGIELDFVLYNDKISLIMCNGTSVGIEVSRRSSGVLLTMFVNRYCHAKLSPNSNPNSTGAVSVDSPLSGRFQ